MRGWFCSKFWHKYSFLIKWKHVLIGYIDATTGLYLIDLCDPQPIPSVANYSTLALYTPFPRPSNVWSYSMHKMTTKNYLFLYLHQDACSPVPSTCIQEIYYGFYATLRGLTEYLVCKHIPKIVYTDKGHLRQEHKNLLSKKNNN